MYTRLRVVLGLGLVTACGKPAEGLQGALERAAAGSGGRLGACVQPVPGPATCVRGDERFSLQSVMKLVVGMAVLAAVDEGRLRLADPVVVTAADRSLGVQPIMELVGEGGHATTVGELVERAIVDSDSAAVDVLVEKLGGMAAVQAWLGAQRLDVRLDRLEKELQAETAGLRWRPEYTDEAVLAADEARLSAADERAAFAAYLADPRDTATPRAMTALLVRLAEGELLSPSSTAWLRGVMEKTRTGPDRLRAGVPAGWTIGHKTGTSGTVDGVTGTVNDVGLLTAPDGRTIAVSVFLAESKADAKTRAATIAAVARAAAK
jgi:beta-lactamase class A